MNNLIKTARWDIYPQCNLDCIHCCANGLFDNSNALNIDSAIELLGILLENKITHLNILGKEPFLHPDIKSILHYACKHGFQVDITTNGTAIKEEDISFFANIGLNNIFFSIDGSCPDINDTIRGRGTFDKNLFTLQKFIDAKKRENKTSISVNTVLTKVNAADIHNIIELCASNAIKSFKLSQLDLIGNAYINSNILALTPEEEFQIAEEVIKTIPNYPELIFDILSDKPLFLEYFYKKYQVALPVNICGCKACIKEIYISPNGDISPCLSTYPDHEFFDTQLKSKINIFELKDKNIYKIPFFKLFQSAFPLIKETYKNYVPCNSCPYLTTICYPCPLNHSKPHIHEKLCAIAGEKMKSEVKHEI